MILPLLGAAAAGGSIASMLSSGQEDVNLPALPPYGNVTWQGLGTDVETMPWRLAWSQYFTPQLANLQRSTMASNLFGSGGTPGLLSLYAQAQPQLQQLIQSSLSGERTGAVGDVASLAPTAFGAMRSYDPQAASLSDLLMGTAREELDAGYGLTPGEQRYFQQDVRGAQASRGLGHGPADAYQESLLLNAARNEARQRRIGTASTLLGQRSSIYGDPFSKILGYTRGQTADPTQLLGASAQSPWMPTTGSIYNWYQTPYGVQSQAALAEYGNKVGALQDLSGLLGGVAGGLFNRVLGGK